MGRIGFGSYFSRGYVELVSYFSKELGRVRNFRVRLRQGLGFLSVKFWKGFSSVGWGGFQ